MEVELHQYVQLELARQMGARLEILGFQTETKSHVEFQECYYAVVA